MSMTCPECAKEITAYPCKCGFTPKHEAPPTPFRETYRALGIGPSREEFGRDLYDVLETIGGILGLEQKRVAAIHYSQGYKMQGILEQKDALRKQLALQLPKLNDEEMKQLLAAYPWVVSQ